jgi:DEAD/DEAH box helicase domain-containing protein
MDTLVFDIETKNFFTDEGVGWNNFEALRISIVGVYSYLEDKYYCFDEHEIQKLAALFLGAKTIVGFASNRYDIPVLNLYFQKLKDRAELNLWLRNRIDLLDEIERATGGDRISLSLLAEANLGVKKEHHGSEAGGMYERGEIAQLKEYCLKDVKITKELYDIYLRDRAFLVPSRETGELKRVVFGTPVTQTAIIAKS